MERPLTSQISLSPHISHDPYGVPSWLLSVSRMRRAGLQMLWGSLGTLFVLGGMLGAWWPPLGWHYTGITTVMGGAAGVGVVLWVLVLLTTLKGQRESLLQWVEWIGWLVLALYLGVIGAYYFGGYKTPTSGLFALLIVARGVLLPGGLRGFLPVALWLWSMFALSVGWLSFAPLEEAAAMRQFGFSNALLAMATALGALSAWIQQHLHRLLSQTDRLGRYQIQQRLNQRGMSQVYLAWNRLLAQPCVIKRMPFQSTQRERALQAWRREAELTLKIQDPHAVRILDFGETEQDLYLVMESLQGINLFALQQLQGPLPLARTRHLMLQACRGVAAVHKQGILHRDLKPSNLFVTFDEHQHDFLKVLDFGIACRIAATPEEIAARGHGKNPGTPAYMAPERFHGANLVASDIYALGAILYHLLTGEPLVQADTIQDYKEQHETGAFSRPALHARAPQIPAALLDILEKALALDPKQRFSSADAMRLALEQALPDLGDWTQQDAQDAWQRLQQHIAPETLSPSPSFDPHQHTAPSALQGPDILDAAPIDPEHPSDLSPAVASPPTNSASSPNIAALSTNNTLPTKEKRPDSQTPETPPPTQGWFQPPK